ncbi:DUF4974 domain-containing protein [Arenibacter sp. F26102]|uniref:FecR family protein n=1 Tax=Arenibacter sp. F26102 TaxID=2926416 RepID=UPI001FF532DD|nr:FecR domain-containing protein [Arenibacter sp. F26102]MCK0144511.1 DUF4974 domain-containing protein [Arenibacter sp. F26102]
MIPSNIEIGILKYLDKTATAKQLQELEEWLEDPLNKERFNDYVLMHYAINMGLNKVDDKPMKEELIRKIQKEKPGITRLHPKILLKIAAVLLLLLGFGYFFNQKFNEVNVEQLIDPNQITLQLDNGDIEVISEDGTRKIIDAEGNEVGVQKGNTLNYNEGSDPEKLIHNQLNIPNGKQFELVLSDGSSVFLNSGSSIKYPVKFLPGKTREVVLNGEAYFKIAKDSINPFIVNIANLKVRVLGTEFNLTSYPEDSQVTTVLVNGSVGLYSGHVYKPATTTVMKPGFRGVYDHTSGDITLDEVDTSLYTSWKAGKLVFRSMQFKNIVKKLERAYNVKIVNNNKELGEQYFSASFDKDELMEQIFASFRTSYRFTYTIENGKIIIN